MVLPTFHHASAAKQAKVRAALLTEFATHPLAQAQVARIVASAGIARGAFYKYFTDLEDSYRYLFGTVMREIHAGLPQRPDLTNTAAYVEEIRHFLTAVDEGGYRALITMHYRYNETVLGVHATRVGESPIAWATTVLYHQTVRDILLDPDSIDQRLAQLAAVLRQGENNVSSPQRD